jgi:hypothetical protein
MREDGEHPALPRLPPEYCSSTAGFATIIRRQDQNPPSQSGCVVPVILMPACTP